MATQAEKLVRIEHPKSGHRFAVSEHVFKHRGMNALEGKTYEQAGFKIVSFEDGTEYKEGVTPSKYAILGTVGTPEIGSVPEEKAAKKPAATKAQEEDHGQQQG